MPNWPALVDALDEFGIRAPDLANRRPVRGGDISSAWHIQTKTGPVFLKTGGLDFSDLFAAEADGLKELQRSNAVRVPDVFAVGESRSDSFLLLEWLDLGPHSAEGDRVFGRQLALLHSRSADRYGWKRDNWIGRTPQINSWSESWLDFYRDHRLLYQFETAALNGFSAELQETGAELAECLPDEWDAALHQDVADRRRARRPAGLSTREPDLSRSIYGRPILR